MKPYIMIDKFITGVCIKHMITYMCTLRQINVVSIYLSIRSPSRSCGKPRMACINTGRSHVTSHRRNAIYRFLAVGKSRVKRPGQTARCLHINNSLFAHHDPGGSLAECQTDATALKRI